MMKLKVFKFLFSMMFLLLVFFVTNVNAAWIENFPGEVTQPDGTVVKVLLEGDEFHNWAKDENGYTIIQDEVSGFWCWAVEDGHVFASKTISVEPGDIVSSGYPIHLYSPDSLGLSPHVNITAQRYLEKRRYFEEQFRSDNHHRAPSTGVINNLVVFIRFSDDSEFTVQNSFYDSMFNASGLNANSLYQYFWDASYNQLEVYSPFFPVSTGNIVVSYQATQPRSYYQPYNAVTNPNGYQGGSNGSERRIREHSLLRDVIQFVSNQIPSDLIIDSDNDGLVDNVCFVVRGGTDAWAELLWPHMWSLYTYNVFINGKRVYSYNFNIEYHMNSSGVSVLAHEFAHTLGVPDFYRYSGSYNPIGLWDLMASNTTPAQSISAYNKAKYTQWVPGLKTISYDGTYTIFPNNQNPLNHAFRINSPNATNQYFVVEYRSTAVGLTDSALPGSGLLVYRVNTSAGNGNADPPDELYVYRPNGTTTNNGNINQAFFSQQSGRTVINDTSNPRAFLVNDGNGGLNISNVGSAGESISFYVNVNNPNAVFNTPQNLQATAGNSVVELNWTAPLAVGATQSLNGFVVYRDNIAITSIITGSTYNDTTAEQFATYEYYVKAIYANPNGDSEPSNAVSITLDGLLPVVNLFAVVEYYDVYLNWDVNSYVAVTKNERLSGNNRTYGEDNIANTSRVSIQGFKVYRNNEFLYETASNEYFYNDFALAYGEYTYSVSIVYDIGESPPKETVAMVYNIAPPQNLVPTAGITSIDLTWGAPMSVEGILGYKVYRDEIAISGTTTNLFFTDSNLVNGISYKYFVTTIYVTGESEPSNMVEAALLTLLPPTNLVSDVVYYDVFLSWEMSMSHRLGSRDVTFIGFNVYRDGELLTENPIGDLNFGDVDLLPGQYVYRIVALYFEGESDAVEENVTVYELASPINLMATTDDEQGLVSLAWEAPLISSGEPASGLIGYLVHRDGVNLTEVPIVDVSFLEKELSPATYIYSVFSKYETGESIPIQIEATINPVSDFEINPHLKTELLGNFPNPFNPETHISFALAKQSDVEIDIFNVKGQKIKTLFDGVLDGGEHVLLWNGKDDFGYNVGSGIYFYRMKTNDYLTIKRMVLLK